MNRFFEKPLLNFMILLMGSLLLTAGCSRNSDQPLPNIILIMADDLGYGGLSSYGDPGYQTPNIDHLAEEGLKFTSFYANAPVCTPTRAALLTGRYQQRSGLEGVIYVRGETRQTGLSPNEITIAEVLQKAGYQTGITGKWHLGYKQKYNPVHQGFDQFYGFLSGNIDYHSHYDNAGIYDWWHNTDSLYEEGYSTDLITEHSVEFIENNKDRPFFLLISHEVPHVPFQGRTDSAYRFPDTEFSYYGPVEDRQRAYADMMTAMDEGVGKIIEKLEKEDLQENTLVLFISDNGGLEDYGDNGSLRGNKGSLWEGGIRVPAIAWWPGRIKPGATAQTAMSFDLFPTFLELADVKKPDSLYLDGRDLSPMLLEGEELARRDLFWRYRGQKAAIRGPWKLLITETDTLLFNLEQHLTEQNNRFEKHPERVDTLMKALSDWEQEVMQGIELRTE